jgi:predicted outer membrane repeat protein
VLDGFTITQGYADDSTYHYGGGIEIINSSPTLSNLSIENNTAYFGGGADFYNSSPILSNVDFWNNAATYVGGDGGNGGGLYIRVGSHPMLNRVGIYNNTANRTGNEAGGGGLYNDQTSGGLNLTDVNFHGNSATQGGGGMYNYKVHVTMNRVHFLVNYAAFGGGLLMDGEDGVHSLLINVNFIYNTAQSSGGKGGGLYNYESSPILVNTYFNQNNAYFYGGGIGNYHSSPTLINTSFSLNTAPGGGGAIYNSSNSHPVVENSILWGDSAGEIYNEIPPSAASDTTIAYSLVQGCKPGGIWNSTLCGNDNHNLADADPLFVNTAPGDPFSSNLHLRLGSPAINKGNNTYIIPYPTDMDLQPRIQNGVVDLGPYELRIYMFDLPMVMR